MKTKLKKMMLAALAAGMLTTTAISGATAQTLRFVSWQNDDGGMGDWWKAAISEFEASHPGVNIEFTKVERKAYADTMTEL